MKARSLLITSLLGIALLPTAPGPAQAMCGGNIFATCPPPANAAAQDAARQKREKRLEAVRAKKRHYPLGKS